MSCSISCAFIVTPNFLCIYTVFFKVLLVSDCCHSYSVQAYRISSRLIFLKSVQDRTHSFILELQYFQSSIRVKSVQDGIHMFGGEVKMGICRNSHLPTLTYHMDNLQYKLCLLLQHQTFSIYKHCFFQSSISIRLLSSLFRIGVQSQQQVVFLKNQYKMEPIVLYQSYSSFRVL